MRWTTRALRGLRSAAITTVLGLTLTGCTGVIGGTDGHRGAGSGSGTGTGGVVPPPPGFIPEAAGLRRLTIPQYENAVRDVLGTGVTITTVFEDDTMLSGFASIGAARVSLSAKIVEQFETAALEIAKQVLSNATGRAALVGCTPAATTDDACTRKFVETIGRRAWRRPLIEEEIGQLAGIAKNAQMVLNDFFGGLEYALAGILQSPHFLYRVEIGTPDPSDASRALFDDHELATRMSFFLWNTTPDDQLLDAADGRQLTQGGLSTQAGRLLASDRVASAMQTFFSEFYRLGELDALPQIATMYPQLTATLGASMRGETLHFLDDVAFRRQSDFREIFDSRATFVNAELARLYGVPAPAGSDFSAVILPDAGLRAGILGQGSFLAASSQPNRASPTRRGKFIREMLLCQSIPEPPPDVAPFPDAVPGTAREKLTSHRSSPSCAACHQVMDPVGLALENFDGIGAFRATDEGRPIDATGDLDGVPFAGPRDLATALRNHPDSPGCVARNVYRYAVAHVEGAGEQVAVTALAKAFQENGFRFRSLLEGMIKSPGFVYAAKPVNP
jgi:Protein of unknown function (DUF1592)/Protein of unknown function (DUF1588)/Protein of unknown function (DUF1595)/Protein of unknown function (DUF1587)/Protein of unknown function (DUF1585)